MHEHRSLCTVIEILVPPVRTKLRDTRRQLRERLTAEGRFDPADIGALEVVANELIGAAVESGVKDLLVLDVEVFPRITSVRVRCPQNVELRDEPFGIRERVLQGLAFAWGKRSYADGSVDLWAEVANVRAPAEAQ
jgi:hypothetical protein